MPYESLFLKALAVTVTVETAVLILLIKVPFKYSLSNISIGRLLFAGIAASGATLPYLWFIAPWLIHSRPMAMGAGELFVFVFEALLYRYMLNTDYKKAALLSLCCNAASVLIGLVLF